MYSQHGNMMRDPIPKRIAFDFVHKEFNKRSHKTGEEGNLESQGAFPGEVEIQELRGNLESQWMDE